MGKDNFTVPLNKPVVIAWPGGEEDFFTDDVTDEVDKFSFSHYCCFTA